MREFILLDDNDIELLAKGEQVDVRMTDKRIVSIIKEESFNEKNKDGQYLILKDTRKTMEK